jgi:hypothetical protein
MHASESADERESLRLALVEADRAMAAATTDAERLDISKRGLLLMQRYRLLGGEVGDIPGHEGRTWK